MEQQYLRLHGSSAISEFRRQNLALGIGALDVRAQYIHYIAHGALDSSDGYILEELLNYGDAYEPFEIQESEITRYHRIIDIF